jgi:hypothetical protein
VFCAGLVFVTKTVWLRPSQEAIATPLGVATQRLGTTVVEKLKSGIPVDRILEDARKLNTSKIERYNLLSRMDVTYLLRKHNVEKKRDKDEMLAAALKVQEWNANGRNFVFFFKQQGKLAFYFFM